VFPPELPAGLPPDRGENHAIPLEPGATPPNRPLFRLSAPERAQVEARVRELLAKGFIEPSISPFGAPVMFARKKDGSLRMVIDYRQLNKITVKNRFPLPRIDDLVDQLRGAAVFSSADLSSGFWQIRIKDEDVPKTAFKTPQGLYQWRVLPMGLANSPSTFQMTMQRVLGHLMNKCVLIYLDDLLIFSETLEQHVEHVRSVLCALRGAKLYLNADKCHWGQSEVEFLGHVVTQGGVKVDPRKVAAVADWPAPQNIHHLRSFLGLTNYFRKFLTGYASVVRPLNALLAKGVPWAWGADCAAAFARVKEALVTAPVLAMPDLNRPFEVVTDASDFCLGACLMQDGHPVAYESRNLNPAERNYHAGEKELLAVVHALRVWRCYLEGVPFVVTTDHSPNTTFQTKQALSPRQARWSEFLSGFDFEWRYIKGHTNMADPLSRRPGAHEPALAALTRSGRAPSADSPPDPGPAPPARQPRAGRGVNRWRELLPGEESAPGRRRRAAPSGSWSGSDRPAGGGSGNAPPAARALAAEAGADNRTLHEQVRDAYQHDDWFADPENTRGLRFDAAAGVWLRNDAVVVPADAALRRRIMHAIHADPMAGHRGGKKSAEALGRAFWWLGSDGEMRRYAQTCDTCLRMKPEQRRPAGPLQPLPVPTQPWESVTTDMVVGLPCTKAGYDAIAVFVERLTKMVHLVPTTAEVDAVGYAHLLSREVVRLHGQPAEIVSDRGPQFDSAVWRELCKLTGCKAKLSSAYHPQTDGQSERTNRIMEEVLRAYVGPLHDDWDEWLPMAEFAINDAHQESVQATPFMLNYGRNPRKPATMGLPEAAVPTAQRLAQRVNQGIRRAQTLLNAARQRQKAYADARRSERSFEEGAVVLLSTKNIRLKTPGAQKLMPLFVGPFKILKQVGPVAYKLDLPDTVKQMHPVFHVSLLRPYPADAGRQRPERPMPLLLEEEGTWYEIDTLLDTRMSRGSRQYLVKWKGQDELYNEWRTEAEVSEVAVQEFWARRASRAARA
jgi:hypothetical protein